MFSILGPSGDDFRTVIFRRGLGGLGAARVLAVWQLRVFALLSVSLGLSACLPDLCGNEIKNESSAPGNGKRAVVFERDCGATTDFSTQVSILDNDHALPNDPGNVLVAEYRLTVDARWMAPDHLVIRYPALAKVTLRETSFRGVTISDEKIP
ncbi:MAG TPA: hypothetical protein VGN17_19395 [Bryobacteraceae bacterium]|jgi:hypothetical protein